MSEIDPQSTCPWCGRLHDVPEVIDEIERLTAEQDANYQSRCALQAQINDRDERIEALTAEVRAKDAKIATILEWCDGNIGSQSQVAPFCIQVRDLLESDPASGKREPPDG